MGKTALILVAAAMIIMTSAHLSQDSRQMESTQVEAVYEGKLLAREIAHSGFEVIERRVRRGFSSVRGTWPNIPHAEGHYSISASGDAAGPVTITSTGVYGGYEYTIGGILDRDNVPLLDALTVDGDVKKLTLSPNIVISGLDTNPDGTRSENGDVHAILTTTADGYADFLSDLRPGNGPGGNGDPDLFQGPTTMSLSALADAIRFYSGQYLARYTTNRELNDVTLGSASSPGIVVAERNLKLKGSTVGHGILLVTGDLIMEGSARWEGVVFAARDGMKITMKDNSVVYGAFIIGAYAPDEVMPTGSEDRGLVGGHFDVDVYSTANSTSEKYHEHKYDDDFDVTGVNLLAPAGCGRGGLCLGELLTHETAVMIEINNGENGAGTFGITAPASTACPSGTVGPSVSETSGKWGKKQGVAPTTTVGTCSTAELAIPAVNLGGATPVVLTDVFLDPRRLSSLWFDFDGLCALRQTTPGHSQQDDNNRDGAFTLKIYRAVYNGGWKKSILVYELAIYNHSSYGKNQGQRGGLCIVEETEGTDVRLGDPVEIAIQNNARIQYSSRVLRRLRGLYSEFDIQSSSVRREQVRESVRAITP